MVILRVLRLSTRCNRIFPVDAGLPRIFPRKSVSEIFYDEILQFGHFEISLRKVRLERQVLLVTPVTWNTLRNIHAHQAFKGIVKAIT